MINIQPYIDKLELLNEWMVLWVNCRADNNEWKNSFWYFFNECGILLSPSLVKPELIPFEKFCELKKK